MRILISNDDGIHASGIKFLNDELKLSYETVVIAPHKERSGCGHGITLGKALRVNKVKENQYDCSGTPADCILVGIGNVCKDNPPDLVVSGINHGANLGQDRFYSGTMAAAREAIFRGIPSISVSLVTVGIKDVEHFDVAAKFIKKLVDAGVQKVLKPMTFLNVNVPNVAQEEIAGVKLTFAGFQQYSEEVIERVDTRGRNYYWVGGTYKGAKDLPGSDCNAVRDNFISINLQDLNGKQVEDIKELEELIRKLE
ncbi:MAG: 5'-nucleotidase [Bacteriovoracaceae bacterium]|jgi:5'-nucleotidase